MAKTFRSPLDELIQVEELKQVLARDAGPAAVSGCVDTQKVHGNLPATVWKFYKDAPPVLQKPSLQASLSNPWTESRCRVTC